MRVGLFVPCYVDQFYPRVGMATVELLEQHGVQVEFPTAQTCCGQPMANSGCAKETLPLVRSFLRIFRDHDYVVCPSGSCAAMVRVHYEEYVGGDPAYERLRTRVFELCEFLSEVLCVKRVTGDFPYRVGLHQSCHGLRELRLGNSSERVETPFNRARQLLESLEGIEFSDLERPDECCGFGGTFAVNEEAISCRMGLDRLADHARAGTQVLTGVDMSCLMHLDGLMRRSGRRLPVMHVAEILAGYSLPENGWGAE